MKYLITELNFSGDSPNYWALVPETLRSDLTELFEEGEAKIEGWNQIRRFIKAPIKIIHANGRTGIDAEVDFSTLDYKTAFSDEYEEQAWAEAIESKLFYEDSWTSTLYVGRYLGKAPFNGIEISLDWCDDITLADLQF